MHCIIIKTFTISRLMRLCKEKIMNIKKLLVMTLAGESNH